MKWCMDDLKKNHLQPRRACWICYNGYRICKLTEYWNPLDTDYGYVYTPNYEEWEKAGKPHIDGLDLDLHLENYVRINRMTAFLYKRLMPTSRPDWDYYMEMFGMPKELGHDPWELMMYSKGNIHEDDLRVERCSLDA